MSVINPAQWLAQLPKSEVGAYARELVKLQEQNIPLPQTYAVPVSALKFIAKHNNFEGKVEQMMQLIDSSDPNQLDLVLAQVKKLIKSLTIPQEITQGLHQFYTQQLDSGMVRLVASPVRGFSTDYKREDNIKGEANLVQSILTLWNRNLGPQELINRRLFPIAVVIQSQAQPQSSGLAYSQNPATGDKSQIVIDSVWGVYNKREQTDQKDRIILETGSWQIKQQEQQRQDTYFIRQLDRLGELKTQEAKLDKISLGQKQAVQLASLVQQIKLQRVHHIKVHWEIRQGRLVITKIKPFQFRPDSSLDNQLTTKAILIGRGLTSGFVSGECQVIKSKQDLKKFKTGQIAVVNHLNSNMQQLIYTASAIVCEGMVDSSQMLATIKQLSLPVIVNTTSALSKLKSSQPITVDASAGKVYLLKSKSKVNKLQQITHPTVLSAVNHPEELTLQIDAMTQGIGLLRFEHFFIREGIHPDRLLKTKREELLAKSVQALVNYYHRSSNANQREPYITFRSNNLTSYHLAKLKGGRTTESTEPNPSLGFRGALRQLNSPALLEFELDLIKKANRSLDKPIQFLLPFVRSPYELRRILALIEHSFEQEVDQPQTWLQINTPENVFNLVQYLALGISGIVINLKSLQSLYLGVDPLNTDIFNLYELDDELAQNIISDITQTARAEKRQVTIQLNLHRYDQALIELAHKLELDAIIVQPNLVKQIKQSLLEIESQHT